MPRKVKEVSKTLYDRLKELKFYCPDDEAGYLFQITCQLAYLMQDSDEKKAELLFGWAKEQSDDSRSWCEQQGIDLDDYITGDRCI